MTNLYTIKQISREERRQTRKRLSRLGALNSFLDFSRGLDQWGMSLQCLSFPGRTAYQIGLVANGVGYGFHSFKLARDFSRWMQKWDDFSYQIPLSPGEQKFLAARDQWLFWSRHAQDLPRKRWPVFADYVCRLWPEPWVNVMASCFGSQSESPLLVEVAARRLDVTRSDVIGVLGPA